MADCVERLPNGTRRLVDDLQVAFALNQPLSSLALAAIDLLDRESLDVVSVIESTLEDPRQVVSAQRSEAPTARR